MHSWIAGLTRPARFCAQWAGSPLGQSPRNALLVNIRPAQSSPRSSLVAPVCVRSPRRRHGKLLQLLQILARFRQGNLASGGVGMPQLDAPSQLGNLFQRPIDQAAVWRMVGGRAAAAGLMARIGNHSFRATPFALRVAARPIVRQSDRYHEPRCSGTRAMSGKAATSIRAAVP